MPEWIAKILTTWLHIALGLGVLAIAYVLLRVMEDKYYEFVGWVEIRRVRKAMAENKLEVNRRRR